MPSSKTGPAGVGLKRLEWLREVDNSYHPSLIRMDGMTVQQVLVECAQAICEELDIIHYLDRTKHQSQVAE